MSKSARSIYFVMVNGWPHIEDPRSMELLASLKNGQWYQATVKSDRSRGKMGEWWAGLGWMISRWQGTGDERAKIFPDKERLHRQVLVFLGYYTEEPRYLGKGEYTVIPVADSIRFEAMSEAEFITLFEHARVMAYDQWGLDPWDEWRKEQQAKKDLKG